MPKEIQPGIEVIEPGQIDSLLQAYKVHRDQFEAGGEQNVIDGINGKMIGGEAHTFKEIGRNLTRADIVNANTKKRLRRILKNIESAIAVGYVAGNSVAEIKAAIAVEVS